MNNGREAIHTESVIKQVMSLLESLNGIIEGTSCSLVKQLFPYILPRLQKSVGLLGSFSLLFYFYPLTLSPL